MLHGVIQNVNMSAGGSTEGLETVLGGESLCQLQKVLDGGDVVRFRVYEVNVLIDFGEKNVEHCFF